MSVATLDTHEVVKDLRSAGFTDEQAEAVARNLRKAQDLGFSTLATKADLDQVVLATKVDIEKVRGEVEKVRGEVEKVRGEVEKVSRRNFGNQGRDSQMDVRNDRFPDPDHSWRPGDAHQGREAMNRPAHRSPRMSLDDFEELLADQPEDERWELINGRVVRMMVGARWEHNQIITNLNVALVNRFRADTKPYRTLVETFRMRREAAHSSLLPDLIVYCRPLAPGATSLDDPSVVFEVLSEGTRRRDREDKWAVYQTLPSLRHYVLVTRDHPHIETIDRVRSEWGGFRITDGLAATLALPDIDVAIPLAEIYADLFV